MKLQDQFTIFTTQPMNGWCVTSSSDIEPKDILKYGFHIKDNRLHPDDIESIKKFEEHFDIFDFTHPETTSLTGSVARVICLKRKESISNGFLLSGKFCK